MRRTRLRPDEQAAWLRGVLRKTGVRKPIIVAHSIAAAVALSYALRFPDEIAADSLDSDHAAARVPA